MRTCRPLVFEVDGLRVVVEMQGADAALLVASRAASSSPAATIAAPVELREAKKARLDSNVKHYCVWEASSGLPSGVTKCFGTYADLVRNPSQPWNGRAAIKFSPESKSQIYPNRKEAEAKYRAEHGLDSHESVPYFA